MDGNAVQEPNSGRARKSSDPSSRRGRTDGSTDRQHGTSTSPSLRNPSLRVRTSSISPTTGVASSIKEELWFGGHDNSIAESNAARSMAAVVGRIVGAKPFPESARRLADLTRSEVIRIEPVVQVLERDPALSARLLRLVNSAGYALRQRCTSVRHAATLVGTDRLHQIATTAAVLDIFDARGSIASDILEHSTVTGAISRYLGAHLALPVDDLFTAGFLHDIGKLMLLETEGDQYIELLSTHAHQPDIVHVAERSLYGFDHAVLAAHVLSEWNIPDPIPKLVAWHHDSSRAFGGSTMMVALTQTVRLADTAAHALLNGANRDQFSALADSESASYLDISSPQLSFMWDDLYTLCQKSIEQCRGENAPALDPCSMRPRQSRGVPDPPDSARSPELPLQFPCVVCCGPTFGNICQACGGNMCPEHHIAHDDWCTLCARDYRMDRDESSFAVPFRLAAGIGISTLLVSAAIGYESGGAVGAVQASVGTSLLLLLGGVLLLVGQRWLRRVHFVRTRPNRRVIHAFASEGGGGNSIAPPVTNETSSISPSNEDPLSELIRMAGTGVEHVVFNDIPAVPAEIARSHYTNLDDSLGHTAEGRQPPTQSFDAESPGSARPSSALEICAEHDDGLSVSRSSIGRSETSSTPISDPPSIGPLTADTSSGAPASFPFSGESPVGRRPIVPSPMYSVGAPKPEDDPIEPASSQSDFNGKVDQGSELSSSTRQTNAILDSLVPPQPHPLAAIGSISEAISRRSIQCKAETEGSRKELPDSTPPLQCRAETEGSQEELPDSTPTFSNEEAVEERATLVGIASLLWRESNQPALSVAATDPPAQSDCAVTMAPDAPDPPAAFNPTVEMSAAQNGEIAMEVSFGGSFLGEADSATLDNTNPVAPTATNRAPSPSAATSQPSISEHAPFFAAPPPRVEAPNPASTVSDGTPLTRVIPLHRTLESEPPPMKQTPWDQMHPPTDDLVDRLAGELIPDLSSPSGQDFKSRVLELVAQRVAEVVAGQLMQSFETPVAAEKRRRNRSQSTPANRADSTAKPVTLPSKRKRKSAPKH